MISKIRALRAANKIFKSDQSEIYRARMARSLHDVESAQKLHALVYLDRGYVQGHMMAEDGRILSRHDPVSQHSDYFIVTKAEKGTDVTIAAARQITSRLKAGHQSFPLLEQFDLYPGMRAKIEAHDPARLVEISALAKKKGESSYATFVLYREMWQHSQKSGHQLWLMACDAMLYRRLEFLFRRALVQVGPEVFYKGHQVVPAILDIPATYVYLRKLAQRPRIPGLELKRNMAAFFLKGL